MADVVDCARATVSIIAAEASTKTLTTSGASTSGFGGASSKGQGRGAETGQPRKAALAYEISSFHKDYFPVIE